MKLDKKIVERRIRLMEAEGVVFRTGMKVGEDVSADELRRAYDAVLLCCGAGRPRDLKLPGRDAEGVYFAVDFLTAPPDICWTVRLPSTQRANGWSSWAAAIRATTA